MLDKIDKLLSYKMLGYYGLIVGIGAFVYLAVVLIAGIDRSFVGSIRLSGIGVGGILIGIVCLRKSREDKSNG